MSIYAPAADLIWELVRSYDLDPTPVFEQAGVDPRLRFDQNARLARDQVNALHAAAFAATGDEAIGLRVVSAFHPSHMGALGYAWLASRTLRDAWRKVQRYSQVDIDSLRITLAEHAGEFHVSFFWDADWEAIPPQITLVMALLTHLNRRILGHDLAPLRVEFSIPEPREMAPFEAFFGCDLQFGRPQQLLVLPVSILDRPVPRALPELELATEEMVNRYLALRDKEDILSQVRCALFECLPEGGVSAERIAGQLHMSTRTLRRRLDEEGLSFRELLTDVRRALALRYLQDESLSLTEISYLLGFSEPSSFTRAFRGWTGQSPSKARQAPA